MITSTASGQNATKTTIIVVLAQCPASFVAVTTDVKVALGPSSESAIADWALLQDGRELVRCYQKPRPICSGGAWRRDLLAVLPRPRPQQGVAFATLVVEEVGVDGRREGGIVELEREVVASFLGALRPGGTDLDFMRRAA